ncbi:MFS transporter [Nocardioides sp. InS609-2]|uniref:MFS transporter n=1 Tax=Nocardioides sp. InS609-2 TaxID=2760705 RepID=UPI0020BE97B7|nr:MFS transporter [Nocardioides sp. InS609-2]
MDLRELPRVVWVLAASRFVGSATAFVFLFLTLYLTGPRDLSAPTAGVISGVIGVALLVGNFTGGRWGDRFGHRRVLLIASSVGAVVLMSVPWLPVWLMAAALPVAAYLSATGGVSTGALTALAVPRGSRRTAVAINRAASNAGFVIGPLLGALVFTWSCDALFILDGLAVLAIRVALSRALPKEEPAVEVEEVPHPGMWGSVRADRSLVVLLVGVVLVDIVYRQLYTTLPLHLRDSGAPIGLYATVIAVGSGLILLLEIPATQQLRHRSAYPVIAIGYALVGVGTVMFGLPVTVVTVVIAMTVLTAGEILYKTTATAHFLDAAPDHLVGQYQGLYSGASTSGMMLAGPIGTTLYAAAPGLLWPAMGATAVVAAGFVLASATAAG